MPLSLLSVPSIYDISEKYYFPPTHYFKCILLPIWNLQGWWAILHDIILCAGYIDGCFISVTDTYRIMYVLAWRTVYALTRGLFWCLFPELRSNEGNKHQNNARVSAYTVRHKSTYIILFLTRHNESKNYAKNKGLQTSSPCLIRLLYTLLMMSQSIGDDVTMTRPLWREHVTSDI